MTLSCSAAPCPGLARRWNLRHYSRRHLPQSDARLEELLENARLPACLLSYQNESIGFFFPHAGKSSRGIKPPGSRRELLGWWLNWPRQKTTPNLPLRPGGSPTAGRTQRGERRRRLLLAAETREVVPQSFAATAVGVAGTTGRPRASAGTGAACPGSPRTPCPPHTSPSGECTADDWHG